METTTVHSFDVAPLLLYSYLEPAEVISFVYRFS